MIAATKPIGERQSVDNSLCIETVSGKLVNLLSPSPDDIDVHDIAWALSRIPRFAGHTITEISYNVAQHSVYVSELVEQLLGNLTIANGDPGIEDSVFRIKCKKSTILKALFHDGHEAYVGDIPSPIKKIPSLAKTFKVLENGLDEAIFGKFGLWPITEDEKNVIKYCDRLAQAIEGYQFMPSRGRNWTLPRPTLTMIQKFPQPTPPLESYQAFLDRFKCLA